MRERMASEEASAQSLQQRCATPNTHTPTFVGLHPTHVLALLKRHTHVRLSLHGHCHANSLTMRGGVRAPPPPPRAREESESARQRERESHAVI